jgi:hypothetical protein
MGAADLRPLGVGEILDLGIKIFRRRFRTLVRSVAVVVVPVAIVTAIIQTSVRIDPGSTPDSRDSAALLAGTMVAAALSYVAAQMATAASFEIVSGDYLDEAPTWQGSLRAAREKLRPLLWLSVLYGLSLVVGFALCAVPGIYLYAAFSLAVPALLFEDLRGRAALRRSRSLVRGRWWPTAAVLLVSTLLTSIVRGGLTGVLVGLTAAGGNGVVRTISQIIATSVGSVLTTPFAAAVITVLYFDQRVRKEGFDLELLARQIGVDLPEGARAELAPEPVPEEPPFWPPPPGWRAGGAAPDA